MKILIILVLVLGLGAGGYYWKNNHSKPAETKASLRPTTAIVEARSRRDGNDPILLRRKGGPILHATHREIRTELVARTLIVGAR